MPIATADLLDDEFDSFAFFIRIIFLVRTGWALSWKESNEGIYIYETYRSSFIDDDSRQVISSGDNGRNGAVEIGTQSGRKLTLSKFKCNSYEVFDFLICASLRALLDFQNDDSVHATDDAADFITLLIVDLCLLRCRYGSRVQWLTFHYVHCAYTVCAENVTWIKVNQRQWCAI